jgi:uncharacterized membrane protein YdjX (TVP38/TMEM64 family)
MKLKSSPYPALIIIIGLFAISYLWFEQTGTERISAFIDRQGLWAPIFYMLLMVLAVVISPIPSLPLAIASGSIFGGLLGGLYSITGAAVGAQIAFEISRKLARPWVMRHFPDAMMLSEKKYSNTLPLMILATRLLPVFQFDIVSYAAGMTKVRRWKFQAATIAGMAPITFLLTYSGQAIIVNPWLAATLTIAVIVLMYSIPKKIAKNI